MDIRRIGTVVCCGAVAAVLLPAPARGHAAYKQSSPADRSTVASPPSSVWAEYTEPPTPSSYMRVFDPCGRQVDHGDSRVTAYRLTVSMTAGTAGMYRVEWAVISAFDGHPTRGSFAFTSTSGAPCPGAQEEGETGGGSPPDGGARGPAATGGGGRAEPSGRAGAPATESTSSNTARPVNEGDRSANAGARRRRARADDDPAVKAVGAPRSDAEGDDVEEPSADDEGAGIPLDGLVVGLVLAALIGAAGGHVYAGIVGPKR